MCIRSDLLRFFSLLWYRVSCRTRPCTPNLFELFAENQWEKWKGFDYALVLALSWRTCSDTRCHTAWIQPSGTTLPLALPSLGCKAWVTSKNLFPDSPTRRSRRPTRVRTRPCMLTIICGRLMMSCKSTRCTKSSSSTVGRIFVCDSLANSKRDVQSSRRGT